ncbi:MAG: hypothetical protein GF346_11600 [Candidatus Eisenbacteria bacterium]|nr:hypothetical protein [Candidatus Latescibacterota bacterium]MBD3303081.1 hypothetical protein [Candidatus Eisenbacteria bacterium]
MRNTTRVRAVGKRICLTALGFLVLAGAAGPAGADDPDPKKVIRQIGVMESIVDQVLIDSPYFLVHGGDNTRGLYIEDFGAVFTFDASLVGRNWIFDNFVLDLKNRFEIKTNDDGDKVIILKDADSREQVEELEKQKETEEEYDPETVFQNGKQEMMQTLLDYGETMTSLSNDQHVVIAAFLKGNEFFKERQISRLILKARMNDLRDFSAGRINEDTARSRILVEEY